MHKKVGPEDIGDFAVAALVAEASLSPKPGLVDKYHNGAHGDMNHGMFLASAEALRPAFVECAGAGLSFRGEDLRELLPSLRRIGLAGEEAMFRATGGVNTHKGAVFSLGLLCAAAGIAISRTENVDGAVGRDGSPLGAAPLGAAPLGERICFLVGDICHGLVSRELAGQGEAGTDSGTAGMRLFRALGIPGARGQAESGYPVVRELILPVLREFRGKGSAVETEALLHSLLASMSSLEDSCVLSRGGTDGLALVRNGAAGVLAASSRLGGTNKIYVDILALARFDAELCLMGLSPGGSADMLAAGIFLDGLERDGIR